MSHLNRNQTPLGWRRLLRSLSPTVNICALLILIDSSVGNISKKEFSCNTWKIHEWLTERIWGFLGKFSYGI